MKGIGQAARWAAGEVWEKINVPATWRELKALGKKHGTRFFIAALIWELIEDVLFPILSWYFGMPELIPIFLIFHFEVITWPIFFWAFKTYDRARGREPWEPDRSAMSTSWRSFMKVLVYQLAAFGWLWALFTPLKTEGWSMVGTIVFYMVLMTAFGFVHERVWHDTNYGILPNDDVELKRTLAKTLTYRSVSMLVMYSGMSAIFQGKLPLEEVAIFQTTGTLVYLLLECVWAKSLWGICPTHPGHDFDASFIRTHMGEDGQVAVDIETYLPPEGGE